MPFNSVPHASLNFIFQMGAARVAQWACLLCWPQYQDHHLGTASSSRVSHGPTSPETLELAPGVTTKWFLHHNQLFISSHFLLLPFLPPHCLPLLHSFTLLHIFPSPHIYYIGRNWWPWAFLSCVQIYMAVGSWRTGRTTGSLLPQCP